MKSNRNIYFLKRKNSSNTCSLISTQMSSYRVECILMSDCQFHKSTETVVCSSPYFRHQKGVNGYRGFSNPTSASGRGQWPLGQLGIFNTTCRTIPPEKRPTAVSTPQAQPAFWLPVVSVPPDRRRRG